MATLAQPGINGVSGARPGARSGELRAAASAATADLAVNPPPGAAGGEAVERGSLQSSAVHLPGHPAAQGSTTAPVGELIPTPDLVETGLNLPTAFIRLPVGLTVSVPVRTFRVRNLLAMMPGTMVETQWGHGEDLPLAAGDIQLAWSEFEVVDRRLAVRITRLV